MRTVDYGLWIMDCGCGFEMLMKSRGLPPELILTQPPHRRKMQTCCHFDLPGRCLHL
jgi:hypothetical protein